MKAASFCYEDLIKLLLEHGADPNIKNADGHSACDFASNIPVKESYHIRFLNDENQIVSSCPENISQMLCKQASKVNTI